jgi:hypothetical protein
MVNQFANDDVTQRCYILWIMILLVGYSNNAASIELLVVGETPTAQNLAALRWTLGFFVMAKLSKGWLPFLPFVPLFHLSFLSSHFKHVLWVLATYVSCSSLYTIPEFVFRWAPFLHRRFFAPSRHIHCHLDGHHWRICTQIRRCIPPESC